VLSRQEVTEGSRWLKEGPPTVRDWLYPCPAPCSAMLEALYLTQLDPRSWLLGYQCRLLFFPLLT
jgi:hypothetical protein